MSATVTSRTSKASPRIAVIGGGISGLAAAHRVTELLPRAELALFEAADRLGGVLETSQRDGFLIERSADSFITRFPWGIDLCRRLGIADGLLTTHESRRRAMVVRSGRLMPVPDGFFMMSPRKLWPMLTTPVLSLGGKLRLIAEPLMPPRQMLDANGLSDSLADESVASFVTRRLGRETFERLVQPLLAGIYTADLSKLSMAATMPEFLNCERRHGSLLRATLLSAVKMSSQTVHQKVEFGEDSPSPYDAGRDVSGARYGLFVAPKTGLAALVNALTERLPSSTLRLKSRVEAIEPVGGAGWRLTTAMSAAGELFDAVIVALPAYAADALLADGAAALAKELREIPYAGCSVVCLGYRDPQFAANVDSFGFVVPRVEGRRIIAASFASAKFPGRAPSGCILIRAFVGGALQARLTELPDDQLQTLAVEELRDLLGLRDEPILVDIARWPCSMPQYHVGHLDRVERIEQLTAELPALALAGNAYRGVGIPQCIRSGESAAEQIAARWREAT